MEGVLNLLEIKSYEKPRTHIIIDDFFTEDQLLEIYNEIISLKDFFSVGTFKSDGREIIADIKKNKIIWLDNIFHDGEKSTILTQFKDVFWSEKIKNYLNEHRDPIYQSMLITNSDSTQLSVYDDGDYYDEHRDTDGVGGYLTVIIFICKEPKKFEGGDFIMRYENEKKKIDFKNNRCLIFPSGTLHRVTTIKLNSNDFIDKRFAIQYWPRYRI